MTLDKIKESAKSLLTLLGGIVSSLLAFGIDEPLARYFAIAGVVITAILVWLTPNKDTPEKQAIIAAGVEALDKKANESQTYEDLGGQPYDIDPADAASDVPENTPIYQPGDAPAYEVTDEHDGTGAPIYGQTEPLHQPGSDAQGFGGDAPEPVSGNDSDLPGPSTPGWIG